MKKFIKILPALVIAGFVMTVSLLPAAKVSANHVCDPGTANAGRAIPHSNARQAESFCTGTISGGEQQEADRQASRVSATCQTSPVNASNCPLLQRYVVPAINALAASVGIVVVVMVAWGGLQYASSKDNPQQTASAKEHIRNALLALVMYIFMVAFLNWIVPGGVF